MYHPGSLSDRAAAHQRPSAATGRTEIYGDSYGRPFIDQWRQTLTEAPAAAKRLWTRRIFSSML